jgi:hypothetical protein
MSDPDRQLLGHPRDRRLLTTLHQITSPVLADRNGRRAWLWALGCSDLSARGILPR